VSLVTGRMRQRAGGVADLQAAVAPASPPTERGRHAVMPMLDLLRSLSLLKAHGEARVSRLTLCRTTQRVLATGLTLLGITALDRM